jgi:hypothetical protein
MSAFKLRAGQREFEQGVSRHRVCALVARRQYGKTTLVARIALKKMMKTAGHTVIFGSVKVDLGREIVRKESETIYKTIQMLAEEAKKADAMLDIYDEQKGKSVAGISLDDFADLYEASRLEFRLYHSKSIYSRTKVVALTPDAVGETGDLILDEVGRAKKFREVMEAMKPIIASNPAFRCIFTTTPPPDDSHYSYELLAYPIGAEFPVNPKGNWYRSELGITVLRVSAYDAFADGVPLYDDDTGAPISPEESRSKDTDKDAWDRNYGVKFLMGGTAACGLLLLNTAQSRAIGECAHFLVESDADMEKACKFLAEHIGPGRVGIGMDVATTEGGVSNPSSISVTEESGADKIVRLIVTWKTKDPYLAKERIRKIIDTVAARKEGGRARRFCIDATNERYFAAEVRQEFAPEIPVELVVSSETTERPGEKPMTMKQYLGGLLVAELDDNHLWLPPERYIREDFRLVMRNKGSFSCEPDNQGRHGDAFDSTKLSIYSFEVGGPVDATAAPTSDLSAMYSPTWRQTGPRPL